MRWLAGIILGIALAPLGVGQAPPKALPNLALEPVAEPRSVKLSARSQPIHNSAARGMEWLQRANQPDGKFVPGFLPALAARMDGDAFVPQAEAALALIRAAQYHRDEKALALGKQSLLRLLQDTTVDTAQPTIRFTSAPDPFVNRLAACGSLLQAINELNAPPEDLRAQSQQLANYIASQLQADGTFLLNANDPALKVHLQQTCAGPALAGLCAAERQSSAGRKDNRSLGAIAAYIAMWRQAKSPLLVPGLTAACAAKFEGGAAPDGVAAAVFEMNDWLLTQQYTGDPRQPLWNGGFVPWQNGKTNQPPDASSAIIACSLVDAYRVARAAGDSARAARYRQALEQSLAFLMTLQYTDARVQHFAEWFRPWILGGFFNTHQDGNLRLANTANATAAMVGYMKHVAPSAE